MNAQFKQKPHYLPLLSTAGFLVYFAYMITVHDMWEGLPLVVVPLFIVGSIISLDLLMNYMLTRALRRRNKAQAVFLKIILSGYSLVLIGIISVFVMRVMIPEMRGDIGVQDFLEIFCLALILAVHAGSEIWMITRRSFDFVVKVEDVNVLDVNL